MREKTDRKMRADEQDGDEDVEGVGDNLRKYGV